MLKLDTAHVITKKKQRHNLRLQSNHSEKLMQFTYCLHDEWEFFGECRQIISSGLFSENKRDCLTQLRLRDLLWIKHYFPIIQGVF